MESNERYNRRPKEKGKKNNLLQRNVFPQDQAKEEKEEKLEKLKKLIEKKKFSIHEKSDLLKLLSLCLIARNTLIYREACTDEVLVKVLSRLSEEEISFLEKISKN